MTGPRLSTANDWRNWFTRMKFPWHRRSDAQDFSSYSKGEPSRKRLLIERCNKLGVGIYVDDSSENSSGVYSEFRGVASEAELERRLNARRSVAIAGRASIVSLLALLVRSNGKRLSDAHPKLTRRADAGGVG